VSAANREREKGERGRRDAANRERERDLIENAAIPALSCSGAGKNSDTLITANADNCEHSAHLCLSLKIELFR
jgi:hypothetical protein